MSRRPKGEAGKAYAERREQSSLSREEREKEKMILRAIDQFERSNAERLSREPRLSRIMENAFIQYYKNNNAAYLNAIRRANFIPVTIEEFVESEDFMGNIVTVWPALLDELKAMNPDLMVGDTAIHTVIGGGASGTGKTFMAQLSNCYDIYFLSCFSSPYVLFPSLSAITPINFMMQSVSASITDRVIYKPLRAMFTDMPFAKRYLTWDTKKESSLILDNGIQVVQGSATEKAQLGQAVCGGILDEMNFMDVVKNSERAAGARGSGGVYDQAEILYRSISRRRKRSFATPGVAPGKIFAISQTRYKNDFIDRRIDEARQFGDPHTYIYRKKQYEVQQNHGSDETFRLLVGNENYSTRVLADHEQRGVHFDENAQVEDVPVRYKLDFQSDPESAMRDVLGIATDALSPFITQRHKIRDAENRAEEYGIQPWFYKQNVELAIDGMPEINPENIPEDNQDRFMHIDLSSSGDKCGIAVAKIIGYQATTVDDVVESLPIVCVETAVSIKPDYNHELDFSEVRRLVLSLKERYGVPLYCVSYDQWQSKDSMQILRKAGIKTRLISTNQNNMAPYLAFRRMMYENRLILIPNEELYEELITLEHNNKKQKVDHPKGKSNDISDAVVGACYNAITSRVARSGIDITDSSGRSLRNHRKHPSRRKNIVRR